MSATNLLRPNQISQYESTKESLKEKLLNKNVQDKKAVRGQLSRLEKQFDAQNPKEFKGDEVDKAVKECIEIQGELTHGMPSQEEMRKCPPGAIDKHRVWERENKVKILKWKELKLRLNIGSEDPDVANLERYRPTRSSLNMDNAVIQGKDYHIPEDVSLCVPFSDEDIKLIRERAPEEVFNKLALLTSDQRSIVRQQFITPWEEESTQETEEEIQSVDEVVDDKDTDTVWGNTSENSGE